MSQEIYQPTPAIHISIIETKHEFEKIGHLNYIEYVVTIGDQKLAEAVLIKSNDQYGTLLNVLQRATGRVLQGIAQSFKMTDPMPRLVEEASKIVQTDES